MKDEEMIEFAIETLLNLPSGDHSSKQFLLLKTLISQIFTAMDKCPFEGGKIYLERWAVLKIGDNLAQIGEYRFGIGPQSRYINNLLVEYGHKIEGISSQNVEVKIKGHFGSTIFKLMREFDLTSNRLINKLQ